MGWWAWASNSYVPRLGHRDILSFLLFSTFSLHTAISIWLWSQHPSMLIPIDPCINSTKSLYIPSLPLLYRIEVVFTLHRARCLFIALLLSDSFSAFAYCENIANRRSHGIGLVSTSSGHEGLHPLRRFSSSTTSTWTTFFFLSSEPHARNPFSLAIHLIYSQK